MPKLNRFLLSCAALLLLLLRRFDLLGKDGSLDLVHCCGLYWTKNCSSSCRTCTNVGRAEGVGSQHLAIRFLKSPDLTRDKSGLL